MSKKDWVVKMIAQIVQDSFRSKNSPAGATAEIIVDRLMEEGLLNLGHGNADIDKVVMAFTDSFGTTKVSRYDRFAARRLVAKYGEQSVRGIIKLLADNSTEKYAPIVRNVAQLEEKWVSVLNFLRKTGSQDDVIDVG